MLAAIETKFGGFVVIDSVSHQGAELVETIPGGAFPKARNAFVEYSDRWPDERWTLCINFPYGKYLDEYQMKGSWEPGR